MVTFFTMLLQVHPDNPQPRQINKAVECLQRGGIIIYPTDTIYGLGCDILQHKAIEKICRIKDVDPKKAQLSFICADLSHLSDLCQTALYGYISFVEGIFTGTLYFYFARKQNGTEDPAKQKGYHWLAYSG